MLPKHYRLPAPEIRVVLKTGRRIVTQEFQCSFLHCVDSANAKDSRNFVSRFAFVVGTRVDKRAVGRNRVKRLLRESVYHLLPQLHPGWDVVFVGRKNLVGMSQREVEVLVQNVFINVGLLSNNKEDGFPPSLWGSG